MTGPLDHGARDTGGTPRYAVRTSTRARYAHLVVSPRDGVVVVVPRRFDPRHIPGLVASRAEWIRRAERRIADARASVDEPASGDSGGLPELVYLRALEERWSVSYREGAGARIAVKAAGDAQISVSGPLADASEVLAGLGGWLADRARTEVGPWLARLAAERAIEVTGVSVRAQRSRWASCSMAGRVSVNRNLLFLPRPLAEHVLLHELCHRHEMNHSPRFWRLLESHDPDTASHKIEMRSAWKYVPSWAQG